MPFRSTKTYTHSVGLSCAFRQWRAESHCRFLHGYALEIRFEFIADQLDNNNWAVNFGGLKSLKSWLENLLDHKTLVAADDPHYDYFHFLHNAGVIDMRTVQATGCEALARYIFDYAKTWLAENGYSPRCALASVEVREHAGNSAIYSE